MPGEIRTSGTLFYNLAGDPCTNGEHMTQVDGHSFKGFYLLYMVQHSHLDLYAGSVRVRIWRRNMPLSSGVAPLRTSAAWPISLFPYDRAHQPRRFICIRNNFA